MRETGMQTREDAAFNLLGVYPAAKQNAKTLLIGSHLDTVRDAGRYDGPLGVLLGVACVERLRELSAPLPFNIEVVGFSDEEGVRYQTTYLGSRAIAGTLRKQDLECVEEKGIARAKRKPSEFLGYLEAHIEQGPVLEARNLSVGVVSGIAGQTRIRVHWTGKAGHAGTTPMDLRQDALCGAAELVMAVERCGVTATVGCLSVSPGASNVIPGSVEMTLDIRHAKDAPRKAVCVALKKLAGQIAVRRKLKLVWTVIQETAAVQCDAEWTKALIQSTQRFEREAITLPSGAGHDAAAISVLCPVAMLFVRCKGGVSHHPAESVTAPDVARAIEVMVDFILTLAARHG